MANAPLCFILMPFGIKANADGSMINFDRVYQDLIAPAVRDAELARSALTRRSQVESSTNQCLSA